MRSLPDLYKTSVNAVPYKPADFSPDFTKSSGYIEEYRWAVLEGLLAGTARKKKAQTGAEDKISSKDNELDSEENIKISRELQEVSLRISEKENLAEELVKDAREQAESIKKKAREEGIAAGYEQGLISGKKQAQQDARQEMNEKLQEYLSEISAVVQSVENDRDRFIENSVKELRDLAITIAEKIVRISLKSSHGIIEELIAASTERVTSRQWAKISISSADAEVLVRAGIDLHESLKGMSEKLTIEVLEEAPEGTCIIEFPDQIIDAGVDTQLDNIKKLLI